MTKEAQNVAILEACGWSCNQARGWFHQEGDIVYWFVCCDREGKWRHPPLFFEDLNACFEMEKVLDKAHRDNKKGSQCHDYSGELWKLTAAKIDGVDGKGGTMFALAHATAAQRCEAFLRAIGRWVE